MLVKHLFLDHCWVCNVRFATANPPGPANEQRHHIIPRAFGGEDGPQVSLCDGHHVKLHRMAEILPKPVGHLVAGEPAERTKKLMWLALQVANAKKAAMSDPNKHVMHTLSLSPKYRDMLDKLKPVLGVRSREAVILHAIESLANRHFR